LRAVPASSLPAGSGTTQFDHTGGFALTVHLASSGIVGLPPTSALFPYTTLFRSASGVANVTLTTTTSGNVLLGLVTAAGDLVTVNSAGNITESVVDGAADIVAGTIDLNAATGIGLLQVTATSLSADTTNRNIDLD